MRYTRARVGASILKLFGSLPRCSSRRARPSSWTGNLFLPVTANVFQQIKQTARGRRPATRQLIETLLSRDEFNYENSPALASRNSREIRLTRNSPNTVRTANACALCEHQTSESWVDPTLFGDSWFSARIKFCDYLATDKRCQNCWGI